MLPAAVRLVGECQLLVAPAVAEAAVPPARGEASG
jgi:hypothetical protein